MKLVGQSKQLPAPLGTWVLLRKEKRSLLSGLALPDGAADSYDFIVQAVGPEADLPLECRVELMPRDALPRAVMLSDDHCLLPADCIIGVYGGDS